MSDFLSAEVVGSGLTWLSTDELVILTGVRFLKQQGRGEVYLKMHDGRYVTWNCKPDFGSAPALNFAMGLRPRGDGNGDEVP